MISCMKKIRVITKLPNSEQSSKGKVNNRHKKLEVKTNGQHTTITLSEQF